jgi:hypothetical protein
MADQQGRPDETPDATPRVPDEPAKKAVPKKAPSKAAKKTPAKKAPAKAAKKAPAKKPPAKAAEVPTPPAATPTPPKPQQAPLAATNGNGQLAEAAKEAAAQAKANVEGAANPVDQPAYFPGVPVSRSPLQLAVALAVAVLAALLVRQVRRHSAE